MKIFIVTPEAVPYAKTGGLADVTGALLKEFRRAGHEAWIILPFYSAVEKSGGFSDTGIRFSVDILSQKIEASVIESMDREYPAFFVRCDRFFMREGLYGTSAGDYLDNCIRFSFFSRAAIKLFKTLNKRPDVLHVHDWQTALIPFYLKNFYKDDLFFRDTKTVLTIHNLGYQGLFSPTELPYTGIGLEYFNPEGIEFYGKINFLKAGIISADAITTVSESYAREILTEEYGYGLDGVLRKRAGRLYGILNGIDYSIWNPETDPVIPHRYSLSSLKGKLFCRKKLIKELGIEIRDSQPLIGFVGRFVSQKGIDLIESTLPEIIKAGFGLVMIGQGEKTFEQSLDKKHREFKKNFFFKRVYDDSLARKVYAGSDIFLMPSRYEPCGLVQLIAMRYGTIPVARATGGLKDTIEDYNHLSGKGSGFLFSGYNGSAMLESLKRAMCVFQNKRRWSALVKDSMKKDFSWKHSAQKYIKLFNDLLIRKDP
ncbi:MAG: glycogen synthase GlgA [Thermodesulfovibrionales bacterium]|nr:glycogen synthase GlgA [Thermodesulfovibrionales bacterium]